MLKQTTSLLFPHVIEYCLLAVDIDTKKSTKTHLPANKRSNPLGRLAFDAPAKVAIEALEQKLDKADGNWELYLIPVLIKPYPITTVLRLNRQNNRSPKAMDISKLHGVFGDKEKCRKPNDNLLNITKFFNLVREHLDFSTRMISARKDELTSSLSISGRVLKDTLECLQSSGLIEVEAKRRHKGTALPDIIRFNPDFIKLAFDINDNELEERTNQALSEINASVKKKREFSEVSLVSAAVAIQGQSRRIIESIESYSTPLSNHAFDELEAILAETSTGQIEEERIQQLKSDLLRFSKNIRQINNLISQPPYTICFENTKYNTVDEARSGYKELEIDLLEKKQCARELFLSGKITDQQVMAYLSNLL